MTTESTLSEHEHEHKHHHMQHRPGGGGSPLYGLGMIGAWVFYFKRATTTQERLEAFCKGLFWPAFMVYDLLGFLKKEDSTTLD